MNTERITGVPIEGFYGRHHDAELDQVAGQMIQNDQGDVNYGLINGSMGFCSGGNVHNLYAYEYVVRLLTKLKIEVTFKTMILKREFNFETNRLLAKI
jgi:hypothetical protein